MKEYTMKKLVQKGIIYFLALLLILTIVSRNIEGALLPQVTVGKIGSGSVSRKVFLDGDITWDKDALKQQELSISSQRGGKISQLLVTEGSKVNAGELLAIVEEQETDERLKEKQREQVEEKSLSIEAASTQALLKAYKEQLGSYEADYEIERNRVIDQDAEMLDKQQEIELLEEQMALNEGLFENGAISEKDKEQTKAEYEVTVQKLADLKKEREKEKQDKLKGLEEKITSKKQMIAELEQKLALNENSMALYKDQSQQTAEQIKAPISGRVYHIQRLTGTVVGNGEALMSIIPEEIPYTLNFSMERRLAEKMKLGDSVSYRNGQNEGTAVLVKRDYEEEAGVYQMYCQIDQEALGEMTKDREEKYKVSVEVGFNSIGYEQVVPASAIVKEAGCDYLFYVEEVESAWGKKYRAIKMDVEVLEEGDRSVAIISMLRSGDQIITSRNKTITDGSEVIIHEEVRQ